MSAWTVDQIPEQAGRLAVVTGASSGLGAITARELARKGARVVLAVRTTSKDETVAQEVRRALPGALVDVRDLDWRRLRRSAPSPPP